MYTTEIVKKLESHNQLLTKLTTELTSETTRNRTLTSKKSDCMSKGDFQEVISLGKEIRDSDDLLVIIQEQLFQAKRNNPVTLKYLLSEWTVYSQTLIKKVEKQDTETEKAFLAYVEALQKQAGLLVELRGEAVQWNKLSNEIEPKNTTTNRFQYNGNAAHGTAQSLYNARGNRLDRNGELIKNKNS